MTDLEHRQFTQMQADQLQQYLAELGLEAATTTQENIEVARQRAANPARSQ